MKNEQTLKCPHCGNMTNILTERRPNGDSQCTSCRYKSSTSDFINPNKGYMIQMIQTKQNTVYLTASGDITKVTSYDKGYYFFNSTSGTEYNSYGHDIRDNAENDLIAEIPESLHRELIRVINEYHTNKIFKTFIDQGFIYAK